MDEFMALIGAAPTDAESQRRLAELLRRRQQLGALGAITGDRVLQPFGNRMMDDANRYATQMQQTRQADIDDERTRMYYEGQLGHMGNVLKETIRSNQADERNYADRTLAQALAASGKPSELDKARIRANRKRFEELNENTAARQGNLIKAQDFLAAFTPEGLPDKNSLGLPAGFRGQSGQARRVLHAGGFAPVFTDQGRFEEQLEAFAETAARARLKALGEIRPTDADVKGMKQALFGIQRDETTNRQLLLQYIAEQGQLEEEFESLAEQLSGTYLEDEEDEEDQELSGTDREIAELERLIREQEGLE